MNRERGIIDYILLAVGILLVLAAIGFFRANRGFFDTLNYKTALNLQCGMTVETPKAPITIAFPEHVSGYINGCGWEMTGATAGQVQVFDSKGMPVTASVPLAYNDNGTELPRAFIALLTAIAPPETDTGSMVFTSASGFVQSVPVSF